jgi:hypothetical protein
MRRFTRDQRPETCIYLSFPLFLRLIQRSLAWTLRLSFASVLATRGVRVTRRIDLRAFAARIGNVAQRPASLRLELFRELTLRTTPVSAVGIASLRERLLEFVASILPVVRH